MNTRIKAISLTTGITTLITTAVLPFWAQEITNSPPGSRWVEIHHPTDPMGRTSLIVTPDAAICATVSGSFSGIGMAPPWWRLAEYCNGELRAILGSSDYHSGWTSNYVLSPTCSCGTNTCTPAYYLYASFACGAQGGYLCNWNATVTCANGTSQTKTWIPWLSPSVTNLTCTWSFSGTCGTNCDTPCLSTNATFVSSNCNLTLPQGL